MEKNYFFAEKIANPVGDYIYVDMQLKNEIPIDSLSQTMHVEKWENGKKNLIVKIWLLKKQCILEEC